MTSQADFWLDAAARILADVADDAKFAVHSDPHSRIDHIDVMKQKLDSVTVLLDATKADARATLAADRAKARR